MAPLGRNGNSPADGAGVDRASGAHYRFHSVEPDDGFLESCGQDDEGFGHVVIIFDGDPTELLREFDAYSTAFYWICDEA